MKIINSKVFRIFALLFVIGFILGCVSYFIIDRHSYNYNLVNYIESISSGEVSFVESFISCFCNNYILLLLIFLFGIFFFCSFVTPFLLIFRGISCGILFISTLVMFKIKGVLLILIMFVPCILLNEFIYLLMSYYSFNFASKVYNVIKYDKFINIRRFCKNYFLIFLVLSFGIVFSVLFNVYISSNLIGFVV